MLSKNNKQLMVEKQAAKKQRYGLRKLSIGVASVLLGMTFLGAGSISAAENENLETATTENQVEAVSDPLNEQTEITLTPQAEAEKQTDEQAYEEKAVTRTINLYKDGELVDTKVQTVNFHKILGTWYVKNDGAVGVKTGQFDAYDIPEQAGYTAQVNGAAVDKVDNMSVTADTPNQVVDVYYVANTKTYTEERVITRTINIWHDDKLFDVIRQEEVFTREVTENLTTGEKTYGSWDEPTKMFDEVTLPQYEGYKHTEGTVQQRCIVNPNSKNIVNDIKYTSEKEISEETRTVERVINLYKDGEHTETVKQSVTFKREVIKNLVTDEIEYGEWIAEDGKDYWDEYKAKELENYELENGVVDKKKVTVDTPSETVSINYKAKVETTTEYDTVKRVIGIYQDGKKVDEITQVVEFSREVKKNLVTGETEYGEWVAKDGKDNWDAFDAPEYENYTTDTVKIDNKTVKPGMEDEEVSINYTSKVETVTEYDTVKRVISIYQDGKKVDEVTQVVEFSREVKKNLVTGETEYGEWVAKDGKDNWDAFDAPEYENYTTNTVKIDNEVVKPGMVDQEVSINYTAKIDTRIEERFVQRTIILHLPNGETKKVTQDVTFKREVRKNLVTGEEVYGAWGMEKITFPEYEVPKVENYIPTMDKVEAAVVTPDTQSWTVDIYYEAAIETTTEYDTVKRVISIYHDGKKVDEVTQSVTFSREVKKNLATGEVTYDEWIAKDGKDIWDAFDAPEYENYTTDTVKIDNEVVKPGMADQEVSINYTAKIDTQIEERFVQRTIILHLPNGETKKVTHDVTFKREVRKNLVTGEVIYGAWGMEKVTFPEYEVPKVENYIPTMDKVEAAVVTPDTQNWTVDVYYEAATEVTTEYNTVKRVISIYQDGKKVDEVTQVVEFSREAKKNLATGEVTYGEWVAKDGKDIWDAFDAPEYENYTTDTVKIDNKSVKPGMEDEETAIYYTSIVETELEERVVDRTIILNLPNGMKREHVQSVTFKREVKKNLATGEVTYGEWDLLPTELEAYAPPKFEGYVASVEEVEAIVVDPDSQSTTVEVDYYKIDQETKEVKRTFTVRVVDGILPRGVSLGGNGSQHVQSVTFVRTVYLNAAGKIVATGDWEKAEETFEGFGIPQLEGYTTRRTAIEAQTVTPDMEDMEDEILYVAYATHEDTKVVTRTITITDPDGKTHVVEQKATFTRQVLTDQFTGQKTLGDWSVDQSILEGITLPEFNGYKPSQQVDPLEVSPDSEDSELTITYEKVDPDTPTGPDNGDNEKPDTPTGPDNGDNEKPDTPTGPDNGDNEKPDTPTGPDNGDNEKPDTPTDPDNGNNGTPDKAPEATGGTNNGGLENAKDELNSEAADQILNLSTKSNKDNGTMLKNMNSGQKGSNTKGLATQKDGNVASELPALGDETEVKGLGALLAALACTPLFFVAKGKKRKN